MPKVGDATSVGRQPTQGLDAAALYDAIVALESGATKQERERAARQVLEQLRWLGRTHQLTRLLSRPWNC